MRTHVITALVTAALVLPAGLLIGRLETRGAAGGITSAARPNIHVDAPVVHAGPSIDEIRRVVREEMARSGPVQLEAASGNEPAPVPEAATESPAPTPFEEQRFHDAEERLLVALDRGVWNDADAIAFSEARAEAGFERTNELVTQLIVAINDGRVHLETEALPF